MMAPIFGYWNVRGLAEPIRYLLHYVGVEFEDRRYTTTTYETWLREKFQLGLDFPSLPYYVDDHVKLTQSVTILRHLARRHALAASKEEDQTRVELLEQQIIDFRVRLVRIAYSRRMEKLKDQFVEEARNEMKRFSDFLGDRKWFAGENITYVDFMAYDTLDFYWLFIPGLMDDYQNLKQYIERFEKLPSLQNYFRSDAYKRWPIFGPTAYFGGEGEEPGKD